MIRLSVLVALIAAATATAGLCSGDDSKCTSPDGSTPPGYDCCASLEDWHEPQTCANGYVVVSQPEIEPCAYTCVPAACFLSPTAIACSPRPPSTYSSQPPTAKAAAP